MQGVVRGFTRERKDEALERPIVVSQIMKPRVDFRLVVRMRVEVDVGIEALEPDPLVLNAGAMRGCGDHGVRRSATNRAGSLQLAAAVGREEAQVFGGHVETQVVLLVDAPIQRDVGVPEADADVVERPGSSRKGQFAAAACRARRAGVRRSR